MQCEPSRPSLPVDAQTRKIHRQQARPESPTLRWPWSGSVDTAQSESQQQLWETQAGKETQRRDCNVDVLLKTETLTGLADVQHATWRSRQWWWWLPAFHRVERGSKR